MVTPKKVKKAPAAKPAKAKKKAAAAPVDGVTVRMFCHGLGDCFLISIPQGKKVRPYHILIDCGIAMGTDGETGLMREVVSEIAERTKPGANQKGVIDLLVVTHEHRDHVSGFIQAQEQFAQLEVLNAWFAWTEDPTDDLANQLRTKHAKEKATLARAFATAKSLAAASPATTRLLRALDGVLAFHEPIDVPLSGPGAKAAAKAAAAKGGVKVSVSDAMVIAGKLAKSGKPATLRPGFVLPLPGVEETGMAHGVRAFVLGPPHDGPTLRRINPRKKNSETYDKAPKEGSEPKSAAAALAGLGMGWAWSAGLTPHAAALGLAMDEDMDPVNAGTQTERAMPFDNKWRRSLEELKAEEEGFFATHYFDEFPTRRIDADWLWSGAQQLALYMESYTNNTSLALAFQLPNSGKVLLFAADAQVGSWLSWHDYDFETDGGAKLKCSDLLARTALYKVGHHGSHNATLREKGLEMMNHPELVAMLPVEKVAVERLGYGEMPLISLLAELKKRTKGRVLHLDQEWEGDKAPGEWGANMQAASRSEKSFQSGANGRRLFMEYTVLDR